MRGVRYSRQASADMEDITEYTAHNWGASQAKKYNADVRAKIHEIALGEGVPQPVATKRANVFKVRVNRHLIIFEQTDEQVLIIRILHEAMDIPRHIGSVS
ncbi:MAG: type II toxin-antitoxin system RelE/ParE family toxin [Sediminimonas qiaohouensis]|uniref:Toxin n=1 Tax=Sediminimonas qiaohouensis TaxID=552061 RepID=A0A7C9HCH0_9RHOB|nr:type II toxin-antitoxin system RelE/ParE family toxin [Sediminimonas qiaohouensis]MTJ06064.1 type II toxin-antitoxin system RelE/ParE family toxin [Sediminimonas qiaohouensis]